MKASKHIAILMLLVVQSIHGMDRQLADSLALAGQQAYAEGDHAAALQLFDSVNTHYTSAGLLFNIGNCHFKAQDVPRAILYYERALRHAPGDEDIMGNLDLARQQIVDRVNEIPSFSLATTLSKITGGGDPDGWARWSIASWTLALVLLAAGWMTTTLFTRRLFITLGIVVLLITISTITFAALGHQRVNDRNEAVLMTARVDVKSEPREDSTTLFVIHKGTTVSMLQQVDGWMEIALRNGNVGWIQPDSLEPI